MATTSTTTQKTGRCTARAIAPAINLLPNDRSSMGSAAVARVTPVAAPEATAVAAPEAAPVEVHLSPVARRYRTDSYRDGSGVRIGVDLLLDRRAGQSAGDPVRIGEKRPNGGPRGLDHEALLYPHASFMTRSVPPRPPKI